MSHQEVLGVMEMLAVLISTIVSGTCTWVKTHQITHFKYVHFIICQLYPNKTVTRNTVIQKRKCKHGLAPNSTNSQIMSTLNFL